jgi:hypothetical protein
MTVTDTKPRGYSRTVYFKSNSNLSFVCFVVSNKTSGFMWDSGKDQSGGMMRGYRILVHDLNQAVEQRM